MASGRVVCVFREVVDEFLGVVSRAARISVKFDLLCSLGHVTWTGAGCCNEGWAAGEWKDKQWRHQGAWTDRGTHTSTDRHRHRHRLESKCPRVNGDVRNSRLTRGSHVTSEV